MKRVELLSASKYVGPASPALTRNPLSTGVGMITLLSVERRDEMLETLFAACNWLACFGIVRRPCIGVKEKNENTGVEDHHQ